MGNTESSQPTPPKQPELEPGDVLKRSMEGTPYYHYAVYVGNGYVIHSNGDRIVKEKVKTFSGGAELTKESYSNQLERDKIVEKAYYYYRNPTEWGDYDLVSNNCEHFATFCATGNKQSGQVAVTGIAVGLGMLAVTAVLGALLPDEDKDKPKRKKVRITL